MGEFMVDMEVGDMEGKRYVPFTGVAGTKTTFTALPASLLESLGVEPTNSGALLVPGWANLGASFRLHVVALQRQEVDCAGGVRR